MKSVRNKVKVIVASFVSLFVGGTATAENILESNEELMKALASGRVVISGSPSIDLTSEVVAILGQINSAKLESVGPVLTFSVDGILVNDEKALEKAMEVPSQTITSM